MIFSVLKNLGKDIEIDIKELEKLYDNLSPSTDITWNNCLLFPTLSLRASYCSQPGFTLYIFPPLTETTYTVPVASLTGKILKICFRDGEDVYDDDVLFIIKK